MGSALESDLWSCNATVVRLLHKRNKIFGLEKCIGDTKVIGLSPILASAFFLYFIHNYVSCITTPKMHSLIFSHAVSCFFLSFIPANYELGRSTSLELKPLHKLLFGRDGRVCV